jgi:hypothetical protein
VAAQRKIRLPTFAAIYRELASAHWGLLPRGHVLGVLKPVLVLPLAVVVWLEARLRK